MGNRDKEKEYRRGQILQIALDQFITKGFYGTTTREICRIAGVSPGLLFHYFESKEALYEALIEIVCREMVLIFDEDSSPIEVFEQKLNQALQMITSNPTAARMFVFMSLAHNNVAQISVKASEMLTNSDIIQLSVPLIEKGQTLGEIRNGNPHALSAAFWCAVQGIAEQIAVRPETPCPEAEWILSIIKK